jgi:NADH dehydrogenase
MAHRAGQSKTVTVFGGSGFIGRYVVRELARRGWRVIVAVRNPDKANFLRPMGTVGQVVPVFCNIRDDASVAAALHGADYAVNLVGILYESGRQKFDTVQYQGAERVARLAPEAGLQRVVQFSAIGADANSRSVYAQTKAAGEKAVFDAFPDATVLRPSIVFGPEDGFFNLFANLARFAPFLPLMGGGKTRFQPVYVGDVADAVMAVLDRPESKGCVYELGGPHVYTFKDLMKLILKETGRKRPLVPMPWPLATAQAAVFGMLPKPLLTLDQLQQLKSDNVVSDEALKLADLGIKPTAVEMILPTYMDRYRVGGRFAHKRRA